jgi:hypothetical protein
LIFLKKGAVAFKSDRPRVVTKRRAPPPPVLFVQSGEGSSPCMASLSYLLVKKKERKEHDFYK